MTKSVKVLTEMPHLNTLPSNYDYYSNTSTTSPLEEHSSDPEIEYSLPVIDFSSITSSDPHRRSKVIQDLSQACQDWGFFVLINHGIPEKLVKDVMNACSEFFHLEEKLKREHEGSHSLDNIRYGTSNNFVKDGVYFWRDFLKVLVHPHFHCPTNPQGFSEILLEYSQKNREVVMELLRAVSESLGLEEDAMQEVMDLKSGLQMFAANYYPPCPEPEKAIGIPPHSDHGLLTFLVDNGIGGLQLQHNGQWIMINEYKSDPNAIVVNVADQLEAFSNGKYKSVMHRAVVNNKTTRMSLVFANGPSLDTIVSPATQLTQTTDSAYISIKYKDYIELQQTHKMDRSGLDRVKNQLIE